MRALRIAIIVWTAVIVSPGHAAGQTEFNVRQLLAGQEKDDGGKTAGSTEILAELKALMADLDSLLAERELKSGGGWRRNIFQPLVRTDDKILDAAQFGGIPEKKGILPELTGIVIAGSRAIALFGEREVQAGDTIDGYKVVSITMNKVVLRNAQETKEIFTR